MRMCISMPGTLQNVSWHRVVIHFECSRQLNRATGLRARPGISDIRYASMRPCTFAELRNCPHLQTNQNRIDRMNIDFLTIVQVIIYSVTNKTLAQLWTKRSAFVSGMLWDHLNYICCLVHRLCARVICMNICPCINARARWGTIVTLKLHIPTPIQTEAKRRCGRVFAVNERCGRRCALIWFMMWCSMSQG